MGCNDYVPLTAEQQRNLDRRLMSLKEQQEARIAAYAEEMDGLLRRGLHASIRQLTAIVYDEHLPDRGEIREAARRVFLSGKYEMEGLSHIGKPVEPDVDPEAEGESGQGSDSH